MANRNYERGREREYQTMSILVDLGYTCIRAASSHGLWDVNGVSHNDVRLVQTKLTSSGDFSEDENCAKLRALPVPENVHKELWLFEEGRGLVEIRDLRRPKPDARTAEGKAEREIARRRAQRFKQRLRVNRR